MDPVFALNLGKLFGAVTLVTLRTGMFPVDFARPPTLGPPPVGAEVSGPSREPRAPPVSACGVGGSTAPRPDSDDLAPLRAPTFPCPSVAAGRFVPFRTVG